MPPVTLLIKPASSSCNLRCKYCFYHSIAENRKNASYGIMTADTIEVLVKKALEYADHICTFAFQGGEPTLAGIDFYRKLVELVKVYNTKNVRINYAIQTNGTLIDEEWARFLHCNGFLTGISLDGPKDIHDYLRCDAADKGSFSRVMEAVHLLEKFGVDYNILCVVNAFVARHVNKVYNFFKKNGFRYLQFIPCLDPLNEKPGGHEYSLTPERYANFLKTLFDLWYEDMMAGRRSSIRYFDNLIGMIMGYPPEACDMSGACNGYFVVEADGSVYPCDFYVMDEWYMGRIDESGFDELGKSDVAKRFNEISKYVHPICRECNCFALCKGGCRRNREPFQGGKPNLNYYCTSYREFFSYAGNRLYELAHMFWRSK